MHSLFAHQSSYGRVTRVLLHPLYHTRPRQREDWAMKGVEGRFLRGTLDCASLLTTYPTGSNSPSGSMTLQTFPFCCDRLLSPSSGPGQKCTMSTTLRLLSCTSQDPGTPLCEPRTSTLLPSPKATPTLSDFPKRRTDKYQQQPTPLILKTPILPLPTF